MVDFDQDRANTYITSTLHVLQKWQTSRQWQFKCKYEIFTLLALC